jgi:hypothetical protein
MSMTLRYTAVAAALLAGTAMAHAQTVITTDPDYIAPPVAVAPAPTVVVPAPGYVVEPAPLVEEDAVVAAPPTVTTETIVRPAPERRIIRHRATTTQVRLTTRQRHEVLRTIRTERPARTVERIDYRVGAALPASVPVYTMPQQVIYEAPALRGYDYTMIGDRMLVVDPASNMVVDELY